MSDLLIFALYVVPTNLLVWLVFRWLSRGQPPGRSSRVTEAVRAFVNRRWGEYHHIVSGRQWEAGERELYRTDVLDVSVFGVDRYARMGKGATCILTDHRLVVCAAKGGLIQIRLTDVEGAHVYRELHPRDGSSYSVAVTRVGSRMCEQRGDLCLLCADQETSRRLTSRLYDLTEGSRRS